VGLPSNEAPWARAPALLLLLRLLQVALREGASVAEGLAHEGCARGGGLLQRHGAAATVCLLATPRAAAAPVRLMAAMAF